MAQNGPRSSFWRILRWTPVALVVLAAIGLAVMRQDPTVYPLNFAEGLPLYFRNHDGPPMPEGGVRVEKGTAIATGATVQHTGK
jgi:hypothetical protein